MSGIAEAVVGIVAAIFVTTIGVILMTVLYPTNPFMAIISTILLVVLAVAYRTLVLGLGSLAWSQVEIGS
jgi:uncharacterized membrane protein YfhO